MYSDGRPVPLCTTLSLCSAKRSVLFWLQEGLVTRLARLPMHPGAQIKPLAGEGAEIVVTAVRVTTADAGYSLPVIAAGKKVLAYRLDPFETKLPESIGILLIIPAAEIGEMVFEDLMEGVFSPGEVFGLLLFQYGSILYTHIEYYCENGTDASEKIK